MAHTVKLSCFLRKLFTLVWHVLGVFITYWFAFYLRFEGNVPLDMQVMFWHTLPVLMAVCMLVCLPFRLNSGLWTYFSIDDLVRVGAAIFVSIALTAFAVFVTRGWSFQNVPRSVFILEFMLLGFWVAGGRLLVRYVKSYRHPREDGSLSAAERVLIVGDLQHADLVVRSLMMTGAYMVVGIVSDHEEEGGAYLHGVRVQKADIDKISELVCAHKADCLLMLPPFNRPQAMRRILDSCTNAGVKCQFRVLPSLADLTSGHFSASSIRDVAIEDLLGRGEAHLDRVEVRRCLKGRKVMVTGAGGSIGQELCRQIALYEPACLVLFELSEYGLFEIDRQLRSLYPTMKIIPVAGDVRHIEEIDAAIDAADGIDVIYHSAAYKHVTLMELNVPAAFRTNVLGTKRLAEVAVRRKVDRFVLISTDKAVRPTSVMGATKRLAEKVVTSMDANGTTFVSVRFGNVLGSSGSVIPIFKEQIAKGGPVTVTDLEMHRYFMTIPEAVDLLLLAGTVGRSRDIMVLEMGEPVRIDCLARKLIELSGFVPDKDIKIVYSGRRPGEKIYEEVMTADEDVVPTVFEKVWTFRKKEGHSEERVNAALIKQLVEGNDTAGLLGLIPRLIPESDFNYESMS